MINQLTHGDSYWIKSLPFSPVMKKRDLIVTEAYVLLLIRIIIIVCDAMFGIAA